MQIKFINARFAGLCVVVGLLAAVADAAEKFEEVRGVAYVVRGEDKLKADLFVPAAKGPCPAVLCVHGGGWMAGSKWAMEGVAAKLAEHGYIAMTINYRLAPQDRFPAQIEDCKAAVRWMRENAERYKIDPDRIGGFGYSAGGHLVELLGTTDPSDKLEGEVNSKTSTRLQAVVAGGAPCDFRLFPADSDPRLAFWLGGTRAEKPEVYAAASPLKYVSADDPPMFFFHGEQDRMVPLISPRAMVAALTAKGVRASLYVVPQASHGTARLDEKAFAESIKFLDEELKPHPAANRVK